MGDWIFSIFLVLLVYFIFALVAHVDGRPLFCIRGLSWIVCIWVAVLSVHEMILKLPDISYYAVLTLFMSVLSFQKEIINFRSRRKNGKKQKRK